MAARDVAAGRGVRDRDVHRVPALARHLHQRRAALKSRPAGARRDPAAAGAESAALGDAAGAAPRLPTGPRRISLGRPRARAAARDRDRGADVLYDALRVLMRRGRAVGSKAYEAWLLAAARANEREKAELLANARADGRLAILHGAGRERRRAFDDGERVDAPARLLEMERTVVSRGEVYAADGH
mmetsp:Transcript_18333/g.56458  ORF Transcript_18333/g.56458 Transcript_18333/m.56458 type:complete len:186 (+) Transcript_18333:309-866(+)